MKMTRNTLLLGAALSISACGQTEPEWHNVCVESHVTVMLMPTIIPNGNGGTTTVMRSQPVVTCDRREMTCVIPQGADSDECPALPLSEA